MNDYQIIKVKYRDKIYDAIDYPENHIRDKDKQLYQIYGYSSGAIVNYMSHKYTNAYNIRKSDSALVSMIYLGGE